MGKHTQLFLSQRGHPAAPAAETLNIGAVKETNTVSFYYEHRSETNPTAVTNVFIDL